MKKKEPLTNSKFNELLDRYTTATVSSVPILFDTESDRFVRALKKAATMRRRVLAAYAAALEARRG